MRNFGPSLSLISGSLVMLALAAACATTEVHSGWDREVDFSPYRSYAFSSDEEPTPAKAIFGKFISDRLEEKGLVSDPDNPDLLVYIWGIVGSELQWGSIGVGYSPSQGWMDYYGYGWGGGAGVYIGIRNVAKGNVVVDLVDAAKQQLVWRSTAQKVINTDHIDVNRIKGKLESISKRMFRDFPPKK